MTHTPTRAWRDQHEHRRQETKKLITHLGIPAQSAFAVCLVFLSSQVSHPHPHPGPSCRFFPVPITSERSANRCARRGGGLALVLVVHHRGTLPWYRPPPPRARVDGRKIRTVCARPVIRDEGRRQADEQPKRSASRCREEESERPGEQAKRRWTPGTTE